MKRNKLTDEQIKKINTNFECDLYELQDEYCVKIKQNIFLEFVNLEIIVKFQNQKGIVNMDQYIEDFKYKKRIKNWLKKIKEI